LILQLTHLILKGQSHISFSLFQALDTFNTALVSPIYYAMFTTLTILASAIMFKVYYSAHIIFFSIHKILTMFFLQLLGLVWAECE